MRAYGARLRAATASKGAVATRRSYNQRIDDRSTLSALEELACRLGLRVRVETDWQGGPNAGGLCTLRGVPTVLIDGLAPPHERVAVLCEALSRFDLDALFMAPALRDRIERWRG